MHKDPVEMYEKSSDIVTDSISKLPPCYNIRLFLFL